MLKAKLVVVGGDAKSKEVNLRLPTVIGRGRDVSLTLPHPLVSRRHTELFEKEGYLYVRDLGSLNGTYVNNRKISSEQRLAPNELLTLGNVTFRAMYEADQGQDAAIVDPSGLTDTVGDTKNSETDTDETVQLDRVDVAHGENGLKPSKARKPLKSVVTKQADVKPDPKLGKEVLAANVKAGPKKSPSTLGETYDKMETPSDILSGDEDFLSPEKSISLSALNSLPPMNPSVSVIGNGIDFGDRPQQSAIDSVDLDIEGQKSPADTDKSDVALGSFLKKLPR